LQPVPESQTPLPQKQADEVLGGIGVKQSFGQLAASPGKQMLSPQIGVQLPQPEHIVPALHPWLLVVSQTSSKPMRPSPQIVEQLAQLLQ
jgi:hypothetical protein